MSSRFASPNAPDPESAAEFPRDLPRDLLRNFFSFFNVSLSSFRSVFVGGAVDSGGMLATEFPSAISYLSDDAGKGVCGVVRAGEGVGSLASTTCLAVPIVMLDTELLCPTSLGEMVGSLRAGRSEDAGNSASLTEEGAVVTVFEAETCGVRRVGECNANEMRCLSPTKEFPVGPLIPPAPPSSDPAVAKLPIPRTTKLGFPPVSLPSLPTSHWVASKCEAARVDT
mmetsp:Transcript_83806/g.98081  ORF Transcript_83806/g.98081 Transcript_83806/m.98081 type:complete len:226 (+) Transcript_83806:249-926(+)